ncbi:DUF4279 domain-containing protein [Mucilaginibacter achroorhodeus]|uniref:DUF4279 domain-containing protein n=1 Tax=Mucilaginibacter achroorhodeus TaxID=2599294 RepID=A0A563TYM1_9SPHI|nr:DUF4279 domain-containing protein [Mucilaginibacter achroorhodeus]TWR24456.1 DUF4279 domain-containing protein [Mucilaginibacter achroorhodeus]
MTDEQIFALIDAEFASPTLGVTEQYLEIHEPVYENEIIKIARVNRDKENVTIAYLPVKNESFFFAVYADEKEIFNISTESRNTICLRAVSEEMFPEEMQSYLGIIPTSSVKRGAFYPNGKRQYKMNCIEYEPNPEPDEFEDKLLKLLISLENDKIGLLSLSDRVDVFIQATLDFHAGNQLLGGAFINLECIKLMAELNLQISLDVTAWG